MDKRNYTYKDTRAKNGKMSVHLSEDTTERLIRYCKAKNLQKTAFVEECVRERLDSLEDEYLHSLDKEQLIDMLKGRRTHE